MVGRPRRRACQQGREMSAVPGSAALPVPDAAATRASRSVTPRDVTSGDAAGSGRREPRRGTSLASMADGDTTARWLYVMSDAGQGHRSTEHRRGGSAEIHRRLGDRGRGQTGVEGRGRTETEAWVTDAQ